MDAVPLVCSIRSGKHAVSRLLIEKGASLSETVVRTAVDYGDREILQFLLDKGAHPSGEIMAQAFLRGDREIVSLFLEKGGVIDFNILASHFTAKVSVTDLGLLSFILSSDRSARDNASPLLVSALVRGVAIWSLP